MNVTAASGAGLGEHAGPDTPQALPENVILRVAARVRTRGCLGLCCWGASDSRVLEIRLLDHALLHRMHAASGRRRRMCMLLRWPPQQPAPVHKTWSSSPHRATNRHDPLQQAGVRASWTRLDASRPFLISMYAGASCLAGHACAGGARGRQALEGRAV